MGVGEVVQLRHAFAIVYEDGRGEVVVMGERVDYVHAGVDASGGVYIAVFYAVNGGDAVGLASAVHQGLEQAEFYGLEAAVHLLLDGVVYRYGVGRNGGEFSFDFGFALCELAGLVVQLLNAGVHLLYDNAQAEAALHLVEFAADAL